MSRKYTFEEHLENVVGKCGTSWIVLTRQDEAFPQALIVPSSCKSNYCAHCRTANLRILRHQLYKTLRGHRWRLLTLTLPKHTITPGQSLRLISRAWRAFSRRWREAYPTAHWIRALEIHRSGIAHLHLAVSQYIPVSWIKLQWRRAGGGFVKIIDMHDRKVWLKRNKIKSSRPSYRKAAEYVTEELEKKIQDPHRLGSVLYDARVRIFATSRSLKLAKPSSPWQFYRISKDPDEAAYWRDLWQFAGWNPVGIAHIGNIQLVGVGIRTSPTTFEESALTQTQRAHEIKVKNNSLTTTTTTQHTHA